MILIHLSYLINTAQTTPGPSQNTDYITKRCRATACHECAVSYHKTKAGLSCYYLLKFNLFSTGRLTLEAVLCKGGSTFKGKVLPECGEQFSVWGVSLP